MGFKMLLLLMINLLFLVAPSFSVDEAAILLKFKESLENATALDNWNKSNSFSFCNDWKGVFCKNENVVKLQLEGLWLHGTIDIDSLSQLPSLHQFSVMNNNFVGLMPEISKLAGLRAIYLANNGFSGVIQDDAFAGMNGIRRVVLANNSFTGEIPRSLTRLEKLVDLQLQNNRFTGEIPEFTQKDLEVNVANNRLEGEIPKEIGSRQDYTVFEGNNNLCGPPLEPCSKSSHKHRILSRTNIILAVIAGALLVLLILLVYFLFYRSRAKQSEHEKYSVKSIHKKETAQENDLKKAKAPAVRQNAELEHDNRNLHFVRDDRDKFELEDLLRASAQVLGSGDSGSSYKAELQSGESLVVKRFKQMNNVGKEKFFEHMTMLGKLSHPNVLPLVAFHYRNEDKLLISDYAQFGSLASHLHSKRGPKEFGLDWPTRLKIIKGVAKGLDYLHTKLSHLILPHGHLKSSNVLLNTKFEAILADYALAPMINREHAHQFMVAYKSPEFLRHGKITDKAEVWSLGILILELLTGRFPGYYVKEGKGANADLASWVHSVVREEWTGEVFDKKMNGIKRAEGQMLRLLKIGMCCCELSVEKRWDLKEAVERIEELKIKESDEDFASYGSEGDIYSSSKAMTDDDVSFSMTENSMKV